MIGADRLHIWCVLWLLTGLTSCKGTSVVEPTLAIDVTRNGAVYQFSFKTCDNLFGGGAFEVSDVLIFKGFGKPASLPLQCELVKESPTARNLPGHWEYATTAPGFKMTTCDPLQPGDTYQVHAGAGASNGRRVFTVKENGDVVMGQSSCH